MKLSLSTASLYPYPLSLTFRIAREVGFEGVELVVNFEVLLRGVDQIRRLASRYGLAIYSVHPPVIPIGRERHVSKSFSRVATIARDLGCALMVVHAPKAATFDDELWGEYLISLEQALSLLRDSGTRIAIENQAPCSDGQTFVLSDLRALRAFADAYDLAIVLDTAHTVGTGYSLLEAYEIFNGRLLNVHFSDWRCPPGLLAHPLFDNFLKHHQLLGSGEMPLGDLILRLTQDHYTDFITLEISPTALQFWSLKRVKDNLRHCISFVQGFWQTRAEERTHKDKYTIGTRLSD